jgi:hypothetical protein
MSMSMLHVYAERPCFCPCPCCTSQVWGGVQGGVRVRVREIIDAGMPMPALVSWMPMPSYDLTYKRFQVFIRNTLK